MNFVRKILSRRRIRGARRALARQSSPQNYLALATEYVKLGLTQEASDVCREGLNTFPDAGDLGALHERCKRVLRERRLAELKTQLTHGARPALWSEICDLYLEAGLLGRAEEQAATWHQELPSTDSLRMIARVRVERYFADRGREQGRQALAALDEVLKSSPRDTETHRLRLQMLTRLGAWAEALRSVQELLELLPGDPLLEARFRTLEAMGDGGMTVERALLEVESSGLFADESNETAQAVGGADVRPILREISSRPEVQAAMYLRGSTMLVQGPRGATAERHARTVKSILTCSRTSGRRLGLGQVFQVQVEGDFGTLAIVPGEMDAGALWVSGILSKTHRQTLEALAGSNAETKEKEEVHT